MDDLVPLPGRRIIVMGGSAGAGEAAVTAFLDAGARVASLDKQVGRRDARRPADRFLALPCEVSARDQVDARVDEAAAFLGGLEVMCVPAGITERGPAEAITEAAMRRIFEINVLGTMFSNSEAIAPMLTLLASEGARYMTGQVLSLDGGVMMLGS